MGIWIFYLLAFIPFVLGGIFFAFSKKVSWQEWVISSAALFFFALIMQLVATVGMTTDTQVLSGQVETSREYSAWQEYYEEAIYKTESYTTTETYRDAKGHSRTRIVTKTRRVFSHWSPRTRWHNKHWVAVDTFGRSQDIEESFHNHIQEKFNNRTAVKGNRRTGEHDSRMIAGDPNDYVSYNKSGWIQPVTKQEYFENRIKAAPSVFSFVKPPKGSVYDYPYPTNQYESNRLLGSAVLIDKLLFDQMNSRLGPKKKVNVIIVGFGDKGSSYGEMQRAEWIGGKKNDLVITFGGSNKSPNWCFVFGWTEKESVKRNLESLILAKGISNDTLALIEKEIKEDYVIKDWSKFDYIRVEPPAWSYWTFLIVLLISLPAFWIWAFKNQFDNKFKK